MTKSEKPRRSGLRFGNTWLSEEAATQHFLVVGTTGSGKSQVQKLLMKEPLRRIKPGSDSRAVIFDAKSDMAAFLRHIEVTCPVYSFNPFQRGDGFAQAVAWDIAADITSPARAQNFMASVFRQEKSGNNQYFTDAARQVGAAVVESFIQHSGGSWTFSDVVLTCTSLERTTNVLKRDLSGRDCLAAFMGDDRTAYQVFTTMCSKMAYFKPVAALWQRAEKKLSVREWLESDSIILLGSNATAKTSLDAINEQAFRVMVEEIDVLPNSNSRRIRFWFDEGRLTGPLLRGELIPYLGVKGRSKGVSIILAVQDIEGLREAAGERIANELIAQLSNKALLRMESDTSAEWASKQLGQFESIDYLATDTSQLSQSVSGTHSKKDAVLPSEFMKIKPTNQKNGLTGYFIMPEDGACKVTVPPSDIRPVIVSEENEKRYSLKLRSEVDQWIREWTPRDYKRLSIEQTLESEQVNGPEREHTVRRKKSKRQRNRWREEVRLPSVDT